MKILHLSYHKGCIGHFNYVCDKLNIQCEVLSSIQECTTDKNLKSLNLPNAQHYNMTNERAKYYWDKYKDYFNKFDCIVTSDTAPLSRIFLQNNWNKKLIIWICNRFDYAHGMGSGFPDKEYYYLIDNCKFRNNVTIVPNTQFEIFYCKTRGIDISKTTIIKPIGLLINMGKEKTIIKDKNEVFFIPQYHNETRMINLSNVLNHYNIKNYNNRHKGLSDLIEFKGIITIPYAWSTLALMEYISLNLIVFVPSLQFLLSFSNLNFWHQNSNYLKDNFNLSEWYNEEHKDLLIYFDSWEDLKKKVNTLNYDKHKLKLKEFGEKHIKTTLNKWESVLNN
tara:strand:+ start:309 stop:1316 length:1008 start_codon:yes stop_codon:yes gene_type:complete